MNENIDLTKILKNCPRGTEFYSLVHGKLYYDSMYVSSSASKIYFRSATSRSIADGSPILITYLRDGRLYNGVGECILFPSEDQRDWSKFSAPWLKKEKFDPKTLKNFDKVIVRDNYNDWACDFFSHIKELEDFPYNTISGCYNYCVPYNDDTKHLIGTKDEAPEYYRY